MTVYPNQNNFSEIINVHLSLSTENGILLAPNATTPIFSNEILDQAFVPPQGQIENEYASPTTPEAIVAMKFFQDSINCVSSFN